MALRFGSLMCGVWGMFLLRRPRVGARRLYACFASLFSACIDPPRGPAQVASSWLCFFRMSRSATLWEIALVFAAWRRGQDESFPVDVGFHPGDVAPGAWSSAIILHCYLSLAQCAWCSLLPMRSTSLWRSMSIFALVVSFMFPSMRLSGTSL